MAKREPLAFAVIFDFQGDRGRSGFSPCLATDIGCLAGVGCVRYVNVGRCGWDEGHGLVGDLGMDPMLGQVRVKLVGLKALVKERRKR